MLYSDGLPHPSSGLRIAVVQFAPQIGRVEQNLEKARRFCESLAPDSVDLLCLPEMIFTGYAFESASAILPFLEHPQTGVTSEFCASISRKLRCYVTAGYPERLEPHETEKRTLEDGSVVDVVGANSAVVYGPDGIQVGHYRKSHLFYMDKTWAKPGPGFVTFHLPPPLNTVTLGICMDLNPRSPWTLDGGPYELADHCLKTRSNLLILLNAWLDSGEEQDRDKDFSTLNYWTVMLRPLWYQKDNDELNMNSETAEPGKAKEDAETIVVVCNRNGIENGTTFAGSSALFRLRQSAGKASLLENMSRRQEGICVWRT
ncbi:carbon-nitrogen hydrolase [Multifurca ochricompacta]|uniref:Carbon-nitrogen hydrolase n=1 Tax=Multifurca ochricompacta TaxID=376703 RepID=A0AAD4M8A1_9AGAM|nr:carbon-nitrogen hydrolase [Multifurca ochricompacta]